MLLTHGRERRGLGSLDAHKNTEEARLLHQPKDFGLLGDVERRFASELHRIVVFALPRDEVGKHLARCFAIADKIVVDEIDCRRTFLLPYRIEFADDLLRRFESRLAAIKAGYVAEFTTIGAATRKLQSQQQIVSQPHQVISRDRKITEGNTLLRAQLHL